MAIRNEYVVNIHDAKTHFSKLIVRAARGERIIIAKAGKPIAVLTGLQKDDWKRPLGLWEGQINIHDDWDEPLPEFEKYS